MRAWTNRVARALTCTLFLSAMVVVPLATATAPAQAAVSITATPNTGLNDGDSVTVNSASTGFNGLAMCVTGAAIDSGDCQGVPGSRTADLGTATTARLYARILVGTVGVTVHDCRTSDCDLVAVNYASDGSTVDEVGRTPVSFNPSGKLLPAPTISVSPSTSLTDGASTTVAVTGSPAGVIAECTATFVPIFNLDSLCDVYNVGHVTTTALGAGTGSITVSAYVETANGPVDCRTSTTCSLTTFNGSWVSATQGVTFTPGGSVAQAVYLRPTNFDDPHATLTLDAVGLPTSTPFDVQLCNAKGACAPDIYSKYTTSVDGAVVGLAFPYPALPSNKSACMAADGGCAVSVVIAGRAPIMAMPSVGWIVTSTGTGGTPPPTPVSTSTTPAPAATTAGAVKATPKFTG